MKIPSLTIKGKKAKYAIVQAGMGVGVSLAPLAGATAREEGVGIISSACLHLLKSQQEGRKLSVYQAMIEEIRQARLISGGKGLIGVNIMHALQRDFKDSVRGAIDGGADLIICGAGMPMDLPGVQPTGKTALVPIVSSARALELICKKWDQKYNYRPDAVVLEGYNAGGHLGFDLKQVGDPAYSLGMLFPAVMEVARRYGNFPVIVAGGIYSHNDILWSLAFGAAGVQMGTRFQILKESGGTEAYKDSVISCSSADIEVVMHSPCHLPFRTLASSPMHRRNLAGLNQPKCDIGCVARKDAEDHFTICPAKTDNCHYYCICRGLLNSCGYPPDGRGELYTVGTNAFRLKFSKTNTVKEVFAELIG